MSWPVFQEYWNQRARERASGNDKSGTFLIETIGDGKKLVGAISYFYPFRFHYSCLEIGYRITEPAERRKGYASEAVKLIVDYLFLTKGINRIQAHAVTENVGSVKVLEKNGFQREGVVRELMFIQGKFWDFDAFALLRREWKRP